MLTVDDKQLLAQGRTAEVYTWDNDKVLKLYFEWIPEDLVEREMRVSRFVNTLPVPSAKLFDTVIISRRKGLIFERVDGPTLLRLTVSKPWLLSQNAALFARLHHEVHLQPGDALPPLRAGIRDTITHVKTLDDDLRSFSLEMLDSLPDGHALCHYDFHPDQIIMTVNGPKILDWMTGFAGDPLADVARTSVLLTLGAIPPNMDFFTYTMSTIARGFFYRKYIKEYFRLNPGCSVSTLKKWMIPLAAARLNEKIPGEPMRIIPFLQQAFKTYRTSGKIASH